MAIVICCGGTGVGRVEWVQEHSLNWTCWCHATDMARHTHVWCAIYCVRRADSEMGADRCVCFLNVCCIHSGSILSVLPDKYQLANTNSNGRHFKPQRWASKHSSTRARPLSGVAFLFLCWVFVCVSLLAPLYVKMYVSFQFVCTFVYQCIILE